MGGKIYAAGGMNCNGNRLTVLEVYDPANDTWSTAAPMPVSSYYSLVAAVDGKLVVVSGADGTASNSRVQVYDPATNSWTTELSMLTPRYQEPAPSTIPAPAIPSRL